MGRFCSLVGILAIVSAAPAQTTQTMRSKYGPPVSETFAVGHGITATLSFGSTGEACEMIVAPEQPRGQIKSRGTTMTTATLDKVLDQLVPPASRGTMLMGTFVNMTCLPANDCAGTSTAWEHVTIYRNGSTDRYPYATIQWKRAGCEPVTGSAEPPRSVP